MNLVERMFALRDTACFSGQAEQDLARLAEAARERSYAAGERFCLAGQALRRLYVVTEGRIEGRSGAAMPRVLGAPSMLFQLPVREELVVSSEGAHCLVFEKSVFFTMVFQCPSILRSFVTAQVFEVASVDKQDVGA